jgi:Rrf2 family protein
VQITAKSDYAMRALLTLAATGNGGLVKGEALATAQRLPLRFLENIMLQLRRAGVVVSQRGADGGYGLARAPDQITIAQVLRAIDGPLAQVRGLRPEATEYIGAAEHLQQVWVAVRASLRGVLEAVTLADVVTGELPPAVQKLTQDPDNWQPH